MKELYTKPMSQIDEFKTYDVVTTSTTGREDVEGGLDIPSPFAFYKLIKYRCKQHKILVDIKQSHRLKTDGFYTVDKLI